jgi:uncharacterized protein (DUF302 family)
MDVSAADGPLVLDTEHEQRYQAEGEFEDVKAMLESAIAGRGLKISSISHISNMLQRTEKEVGGQPIFEKAEALEFCSATLSRAMMQADPHNIVLCPYIIYVYTLAAKPTPVYLAYRKLSSSAGSKAGSEILNKIDALLQGIILEAIE